jgi:hypothetical protein
MRSIGRIRCRGARTTRAPAAPSQLSVERTAAPSQLSVERTAAPSQLSVERTAVGAQPRNGGRMTGGASAWCRNSGPGRGHRPAHPTRQLDRRLYRWCRGQPTPGAHPDRALLSCRPGRSRPGRGHGTRKPPRGRRTRPARRRSSRRLAPSPAARRAGAAVPNPQHPVDIRQRPGTPSRPLLRGACPAVPLWTVTTSRPGAGGTPGPKRAPVRGGTPRPVSRRSSRSRAMPRRCPRARPARRTAVATRVRAVRCPCHRPPARTRSRASSSRLPGGAGERPTVLQRRPTGPGPLAPALRRSDPTAGYQDRRLRTRVGRRTVAGTAGTVVGPAVAGRVRPQGTSDCRPASHGRRPGNCGRVRAASRRGGRRGSCGPVRAALGRRRPGPVPTRHPRPSATGATGPPGRANG